MGLSFTEKDVDSKNQKKPQEYNPDSYYESINFNVNIKAVVLPLM